MKKESDKKIILHLTQQQVDTIMYSFNLLCTGFDMEQEVLDCYDELKKILAKKGINYT